MSIYREIAIKFRCASKAEIILVERIEHCLSELADESTQSYNRYLGALFLKGLCVDYLIECGVIPEDAV